MFANERMTKTQEPIDASSNHSKSATASAGTTFTREDAKSSVTTLTGSVLSDWFEKLEARQAAQDAQQEAKAGSQARGQGNQASGQKAAEKIKEAEEKVKQAVERAAENVKEAEDKPKQKAEDEIKEAAREVVRDRFSF
jgi:hypothetical protein